MKNPTIKEMCEDYKEYRRKEDEKMSKMTKEEFAKYKDDRDSHAEQICESWGKKPVNFFNLTNGENDDK